jgi:hypothetical protein
MALNLFSPSRVAGISPRDNEASIEHRCDDHWRTKTLLDGTFEWSRFEEPLSGLN